ncbi:MAG: 23S ribosomal RNA methyltransferase Erm, partial [Candidatus Promineifilaceae bacterium]
MAHKKQHNQIAFAQNFFREPKVVQSLIRASSIGRSDVVYEIGAGRGIITAELAQTAEKVIAIEKDPALVTYLRQRFRDVCNVEIVEGDFLRYRIPEQGYKIFGNIPFNQTADIMRKILFDAPVPDQAYLVMQKEAAEKFSGSPKETQFSVLAKPQFQLWIGRYLCRTDFTPVPNVDVVLLHIKKRPFPLVPKEDFYLYRKFVRYGFNGWKKSLKLTFKPVFTYKQWKHLSKSLCFPLDATPSELTFEQWLGLFECFRQRVPDSKQT